MWSGSNPHVVDHAIIAEFTKQTGISVNLVPASESSSQRLIQELTLLERRSTAVDVFEIDTTSTAALGSYLLDLKSSFSDRLSDEVPQVVDNATINGRLVAAPFLVEYGLLYYRTDLLRRYGFREPPRTWDELEKQAKRIQDGERATGHKNFWGYVWEGADYEGLTCNALEWQYSQGGGNLLEPGRRVNVDNSSATRAFARAARWVGTISPPGITAYVEEDARNVWQSGKAMFLRNWAYVYALAKRSPHVGGRFAIAPLPSGSNGRASTLGGWYLGVTTATRNRDDAIAFVKYMTSRQVQKRRAVEAGYLPTLQSVYNDPAVLSSSDLFRSLSKVTPDAVRRPISVAGAQYGRVSAAYARGVHEILTGRVRAEEQTVKMQIALVGILQSAPELVGERR